MEKNDELYRFTVGICDRGVCVGDCDKCNRALPFGKEEDDGVETDKVPCAEDDN